MRDITISIFGSQIFSEIITELKLFSKYQIKYYDNFDFWIKNVIGPHNIAIFFLVKLNKNHLETVSKNNFPLIIVNKSSEFFNLKTRQFVEQLHIPIKISDLEKKIILLLSKFEFNKDSLILLSNYVINKNERKIKKEMLNFSLPKKK